MSDAPAGGARAAGWLAQTVLWAVWACQHVIGHAGLTAVRGLLRKFACRLPAQTSGVAVGRYILMYGQSQPSAWITIVTVRVSGVVCVSCGWVVHCHCRDDTVRRSGNLASLLSCTPPALLLAAAAPDSDGCRWGSSRENCRSVGSQGVDCMPSCGLNDQMQHLGVNTAFMSASRLSMCCRTTSWHHMALNACLQLVGWLNTQATYPCWLKCSCFLGH